MANRYATATGNWSDVTKWDGGVALPTTGDVVVANGFTITIDQDITVGTIQTLAAGSGASGGGFSITVAHTINANVLAGTTTCLTDSHASGTVTINGNVTGSTATNTVNGCAFTGTATLAITGTVTGGAGGTAANGLSVSAVSTVTIAGNVVGAATGGGIGLNISAAATVTITGTATGAATNLGGIAIVNSSSAGVTITGTITGGASNGSNAFAISNSATGTITVTGNVLGGPSTGAIPAISNSSTGTISVTGNVTGGAATGSFGITNSSTGTVAIKGDLTAGSALGCHAVNSASAGQVHHEGDCIGVATGAQAGTVALLAKVLGIYSINTRKHGYAESAGAMPGTPTGFSGSIVYLYGVSNTGSQSGQAAIADVRNATVYGPTSNLTGTAYIPAASSVAAGVNVDATVGTATLTAANVRAAIGLASANLDTQLALLPKIAFSGTATGGGAITITLQTACGADNLCRRMLIVLVSGTGVGQARNINSYVNSTKVVTVDRPWVTNPDNTTGYQIWNLDANSTDISGRIDLSAWIGSAPNALSNGKVDVTELVRSATAQAGASGTITLDASASATDNLYRGQKVTIVSGTGAGQTRLISAYVGSTKVATVLPVWATAPDNTSVFQVDEWAATDVESIGLTAQTARDLGGTLGVAGAGLTALGDTRIANLDAAVTSRMATFTLPTNFSSLVIDTTGRVNAFLIGILTSVFTEGATGRIAAAFKQFFNIAAPAATMDHGVLVDTVTTASNMRGTDNAALAATALSTAQWTNARAGYLDALNISGNVASHADVLAINQSASKHVILTTVGQYERPESGTTVYTIEARTFTAADGAAVNADSTPTLTATGQTSGSLSGNLGAATNPATGLYRWTYTVTSADTVEPIRFDVSATITSAAFTLSAYSQVLDEVSATFTATDKSNLTAVFNKLPVNNIADETLVLARLGTPAGASIAADIAEIEAETDDIAAIKIKTDNLPASPSSLDAAGVRTAVGLASPNLDTQIGTLATAANLATAKAELDLVKAKTDLIPASPAAVGDIPTAVQNRTEMDANSTKLASINAKTSNLPSDPADESLIIAATDAIMARLGVPAGASVSADVAAVLTSVALRLLASAYTAPPSASQNADGLLDQPDGIETGLTVRQGFRLVTAAEAGKVSGAAGSPVVIRNVGDTKDRITAIVDADGNRTAVTTDVS